MFDDEIYQANLKGLLPFIYIIPSYIAHIVVIYAIFNRRNKEELGTNFYKLYSFSATTAFTSSIFLFIYTRARYTPCLLFFFRAFPDRSIFGTFVFISSFYFIYADLFLSLLLNVNRCSVVILKSKYQRFWKKYLTISLIFAYLIPLIFVIHMCFTDVSWKLINPDDPDKGYDWKERNPLIQNSIIMIIIVLFCAIGSVLANLYVLGYLILSAKSPQTFDASQKGNKDAQKRLFIFTAIMLINHLAFTVMQVLFATTKHSPTIYFMIGIQAYVLDFINLSPPWFLLFISPSLRRCVLRMNGIKEVSLFVKVNSINQAPTTTAAATTMTTQASIRHLPIS